MNETKETKYALAIFKDQEGKYTLAKVPYTPGDDSVEVVVKDVREDVIDRFKMLASELYMGDL